MAVEPSPGAVIAAAADDARMKLTCSHGGRLVPSCGPDGAAPRYVGGVTRVLAVPRAASFLDLAARLSSEMAGGAEVRAVMHRLADGAGLEDVLVSVTCDAELAHMRDEYDRLRATRPNATFRIFIDTAPATIDIGAHHQQPRSAVPGGLPPLAPWRMMRRALSDQALAASAQRRLYRRPAHYPVPMRRVQSAQELAPASRVHPSPSFHHRGYQCRFACQRRDVPACAVPHVPGRNVDGVSPVAAEAKARSRDSNKCTVDVESRRAIWEFE